MPPSFAMNVSPQSIGLSPDPISVINQFDVPVAIHDSTNDSQGGNQAGADIDEISSVPAVGNFAHWKSSEQLNLTSPLPNKRRRVEKSRVSMSYPRKRAVTACLLCRTRKTKCSNTRPKCRHCDETGATCVYEDPLDHSSFDPASLMMLERLNQILERLDHPALYHSRQHLPEITPVAHLQPSPLSSISQSAQVYEPEPIEFLDECMKIPSSRTTADAVLLWPIFDGRYPPNLLIDSLLKAGFDAESENEDQPDSRTTVPPRSSLGGKSISSCNVEENVLRLVDNFITNVHIKNPILDIGTLRRYAKVIAEDGPGWDGKSCLVLLACALGSIAKPFSESWYESTEAGLQNAGESHTHSVHDLQVAEFYYGLARKRIGLLGGTIIRSQCYLFSGVYLMYVLRPLEAWQNFLHASTTYHVYLQYRMQRKESGNELFTRTRRLEQRLYWSCFKSECEIRIEMSLPESSIANLQYPDTFPSPPNEQIAVEDDGVVDTNSFGDVISPSISTGVQRRRRTGSIDESQQQSWYYYLIEIALRRIGNRILNAFYNNGSYPGYGIPVAEMIRIATDFETQLQQWQTTLPETLCYDQNDQNNEKSTPTQELAYMVRSRTQEITAWLYQPFLYYAIHHPADDPCRPMIQPFINKEFELSRYIIEGSCYRHRHHGSWYGARASTTLAFLIIAVVKCGHLDVPQNWSDTVQIQIGILKYWEKESPDLAKAREVLQDMLDELR